MRNVGIDPCRDASAGAWLAPALLRWDAIAGMAVGAVVPSGFAAYGRVLHPVPRRWDAASESWGWVRWAQVCAQTGARPHALMQWADISAGWSGGNPRPGGLEPGTLKALVAALPTAGEVTYAVWEGWGGLLDGHSSGWLAAYGGRLAPAALSTETQRVAARLVLPAREYLLFSGPLLPVTDWADDVDAVPMSQSASLFWPADRSWCVASEVDFDSTVVGASREVVDAILAAPGLEAYEVDLFDDLSAFGDVVNHGR